MIIDNVIKANDVVSLKLTSSEEIVAKFVAENADGYILKNPLSIGVQHTGDVGASFFMLGYDKTKDITIRKPAVVSIIKSSPQLTTDYIKMTSNIQLPTSGLIK